MPDNKLNEEAFEKAMVAFRETGQVMLWVSVQAACITYRTEANRADLSEVMPIIERWHSHLNADWPDKHLGWMTAFSNEEILKLVEAVRGLAE